MFAYCAALVLSICPTLQDVLTSFSKSGLSIQEKPAPSEVISAVGSDKNVILKSEADKDSAVSASQVPTTSATLIVISSVKISNAPATFDDLNTTKYVPFS